MFTYPSVPQRFFQTLDNIFKAYPVILKKIWPVILLMSIIRVIILRSGDFFALKDYMSVTVAAAIIAFFFSLYLYIVLFYAGDQALRQQPVNLKNSFGYGLQRFLSLFIFTILLTVVYAVLMLLIFFCVGVVHEILTTSGVSALPVILGMIVLVMVLFLMFLSVLLFAAHPAIVLDKVSPFSAFEVSARLVWGNWWRVFFTFLCLGIIAGLFGIMIGVLDSILTHTGSITTLGGKIAFAAADFAVIFLVIPLMIGGVLVLYKDLKLRRPSVIM